LSDDGGAASPIPATDATSSASLAVEESPGSLPPLDGDEDRRHEVLDQSGAAEASGGRAVGGSGHGLRLRLVVGLFACGYLVLSVVWAMSNPAPSGTDEAAHYIKALATARGELVGPHVPYPYRGMQTFPGMLYFWDQSTIAYPVPARVAPASTGQCDDGHTTVPATCVSGTRCQRWVAPCVGSPQVTGDVVLATYVGNYVPTMYVASGLLAQLGSDDVSGLRLARVGSILVALLLVTLAMLLVIDRRTPALSLVGLFISVTPTAVYLNSVVNPNGGEIAASICFAAAMVRLWRDDGRPATWVWLVAGASGALLGFSRAYGPLWIAAAVAATVVLLGFRPSLRALRRAGWRGMVAFGLVAAGVLADLGWWKVMGVPRSRVSLLTFPQFLWLYVTDLPQVFEQEIGLFGWMDIPLGTFGYLVWSIMVGAVLLLALLVASARQRTVLLLLIVGDVVATVVLASVMRVAWDFPGAGTVGRYFLPGTVVITLLAGEILHRNGARLGAAMPHNLLIYLALAAALGHATAIWMAARRFAVGIDGHLFFLRDSQWSPELGWLPWLGLAGVGCLMVVAAGVLATRTPTLDPATATGWNAQCGRSLIREASPQ